MEKQNKNREPLRSSWEHEYVFDGVPKEAPRAKPSHVRSNLTVSASKGVQVEKDFGTGDGPNEKIADVSRLELYKEAMYTCVHKLGKLSQRFPSTQEEMCLYAHEVFSESRKEQDEVVDHVGNEVFPLTIVNANVRRAEGLQGSKSMGLVDPYCVVVIETEDSSVVFQLNEKEWQEFSPESHLPKAKNKDVSSKLRRSRLRPPPESRSKQLFEKVPDFIKTKVEWQNPDPRWNQRFQCLSIKPSMDKLTVEVWDHSIDDKIADRIIRKNSTSTLATTETDTPNPNVNRKKGDEFLGKISVRVADIPCDGSDHWYPLTRSTKKENLEAHGALRVQLWLVHAYRHGRNHTEVADPKIILGLFWDWILRFERAKYDNPKDWEGTISTPASCFLFQYALQNGISEDAHAIIRWNAYAKLDLNLKTIESTLHDLNTATEPKEEAPTPTTTSPTPAPPATCKREVPKNVDDNIMEIIYTKVVPVIRNHLKENVELVHEALRSYLDCVQILTKFGKSEMLEHIQKLVLGALRMSILEWYQEVYNKTVPTQGDTQKIKYVEAVVKMMKEVNALLRLGATKWSPEFFLFGSIEYLPHVYDELQKMIIHDIESTCWIFFESYGDFKKLRKILVQNEENDSNLCKALFDLYGETQIFVVAWVDVLPNGMKTYQHLVDYHRWFRPTLVLWLGFALIRGSMMISKAIKIDDHVQDNDQSMTSTSALDTANVFHQLIKFWESLNWPDITEGYVIINFLTEVMCSYTILFAELKHSKLDKEGYYDPRGKFTISEKFCTALNNIEHVKEQLKVIPQEIKYDELVNELENVCGKSDIITSYQGRVKDKLEQTIRIVDHHLEEIIENVGVLIQKEISGFIRESLKVVMDVSSDELEHAIEPIKGYLDNNIVILQKSLLPFNFHKMLRLLWNLVCHGIEVSAVTFDLGSLDNQFIFYKKVLKTIPFLEEYIQGGEAGLALEERDTEPYRSMLRTLSYFTMGTDELIRLYYHNRAQYYMNYVGPTSFGSIKLRVGFFNEKLGVEIISAMDLTPHDEPLTVLKYFKRVQPTSDAMVELELRPVSAFPNEKKQVTTVKWKNLNPIFEESFHWKIEAEDCVQPSAVLVVTMKDYDLLSKNAFLGETLIPLHTIPGISRNPDPQPVNLALHEVDPKDPVLAVLKTRTSWDENAKQFVNDQLSRFVEPVIVRKIKE